MTNLIDPNRVRFGPYEVDLHTHELWKFGTRIKLVGQPFEILALLLSRPGELVSRDDLRDRLWPGETFVDFNHGLNAAVNKLRDVLSDSADDPKYIETLPRRGYRFIAKVERGAPEVPEVPVVVAPPQAVAAVPVPPIAPALAANVAAPPRRSPSKWMFWGMAGVAGSVLLFAVLVSMLKLSGTEAERMRKQVTVAVSGPLKGAQVVLTTGGRNEGPQYSPDGKRLTFMSNRSGSGNDIWVSNARGGEPRQLTSLGSAGTPRWSPDGTRIAFDSEMNGRAVVLIISADGGQPALAVSGNSNNRVPSWSHDGKYLYFASDRTGRYEVWKTPVAGGAAQQITTYGGFAAIESADEKMIFYAKTQFERPEIWQVPISGGPETLVSTAIRPGTWASWGMAGTRIYFVEEGPGDVAMLSAFDVPTQRLRQVTLLGRFPFWLAVNANGTRAAFDRVDSETTTSIVELEDFE